MRTIAIVLLFFLISCEKTEVPEITDITIHNYAFNGTLILGDYRGYLELGESWTVIIDEGLHTLDLISDEQILSSRKYRGLTAQVFVSNGHNEYFINNLVKEATFYIPDE